MPRFPMGTCAWIFCEVRNDRHIIKLRIVRTSGYTDYDKTVLDAVQSLDNSKILTFPSGSKWVHVTQTFGVKTGDLGVVSAKLALLPAPAPTPTPTPAAAADIWTPFESDLHRRIKIAWDKRAPSIRNLNTREVILTLHVLMDGHVDTVELTQSSSNKTADHAAIDAVHEAAPFLPLPEGATGPRLVQVHFDTSGSDVRGD
jgi:TonB family protein